MAIRARPYCCCEETHSQQAKLCVWSLSYAQVFRYLSLRWLEKGIDVWIEVYMFSTLTMQYPPLRMGFVITGPSSLASHLDVHE